jgi:hypothetical protein
MWEIPKIWEGGDVWIIGGGSSMPRQFNVPEEIIQQVEMNQASPSEYSSYMKVLHDKHVIGVNMAFELGNWIDMIVFGDSSFLQRTKKGLMKYTGIKVCCHPASNEHKEKWIKYVDRDRKRQYGISENPKQIIWCDHSGGAAINVAYLTGAKRIMLLGFDMCRGKDGKSHWHGFYGSPKVQYDRFILSFTKIADDLKRLGIEILNVNLNSKINEFPKVGINQILNK